MILSIKLLPIFLLTFVLSLGVACSSEPEPPCFETLTYPATSHCYGATPVPEPTPIAEESSFGDAVATRVAEMAIEEAASAQIAATATYIAETEATATASVSATAISIDRDVAKEHYDKGESYLDQDNYSRAIEEFNQATSLSPQFALPYYGRGLTYMELGAYEEAKQEFTEAIRIDQQYGLAYYFRGLANHQLEQWEQVIDDVTTYIRLGPHDAGLFDAAAYGARAIAYAKMGQMEQFDRDAAMAHEFGMPR